MNKNKLIKYGSIIAILCVLAIVFCNKLIVNSSENFHFSDISQLPSTKTGLLLGTTRYLSNGQENLYFKYRIDAAVQLIQAGKIQKIVVSGDNGNKEYDEPTEMRKALIDRGIDSNIIIMDFAGFRTFDSMKRLLEIFSQKKAIVISQEFHNQRAIYIGQKLGIKVYGYDAKSVSQYYGLKTNLREYLARVKVVLDFIIGVEPKFLGDKIEI